MVSPCFDLAVLHLECAATGQINGPLAHLGYSHLVTFVKWTPLRDYAHWYDDLKRLAHPNG